MKLIAHRGNIEGPNPLKENDPEYIDIALINLNFVLLILLRAKKSLKKEVFISCFASPFKLGSAFLLFKLLLVILIAL